MRHNSNEIEWVLPSDIAAAFLRQQFGGRMTLGRLLMEILERESGAFRTWLPAATPIEVVHDLQAGWWANMGRRHLVERPLPIGGIIAYESFGWQATDALLHRLRETESYFVVPANHDTPADARLRNKPAVYFKEEVYYVAPGATADDDLIDDTLGLQIGMKELWGVATTLPPDHPPLRVGSEITEETLQLLTERTSLVISEVYDSDSQMVWERHVL